MKELKFRVVDGRGDEPIVADVAEIQFETEQIAYWNEYHELEWIDFNEAELLQFTGLKDKNGKEDYDGNIWEVEYRGTKHRFSHKSELSWEGYIFSFKCLTGEVSPIHANVEEDGIIIGNTHESPELLEQ